MDIPGALAGDLLRGADGEDAAFIDDGDAVGDAKGQVAVVGNDQ